MSDIQEEQKRLYKRAKENDYIVKDIAQYEENDSELAKYTILELQNRINKAIEYIEYEMPCLWEVDEIFEDMDGKDYNTWKEYDENKLLNILKGDNK